MSDSVNRDERLHAAMQLTGRGTFSEVHPGDKQTKLHNCASDVPAVADLTWAATRTDVNVTEKVCVTFPLL